MKKFPIWLMVVLAGLAIFLAAQFFLPDESSTQSPTPAPSGSNGAETSAPNPAAAKTESQVAPPFTLTDLEGKTVSLADYRGKNVYLNFWASWCPPCRAEMPDMERIYQELKDQDFVVLAVNVREDPTTVQQFITTNAFTFPVLLDGKGTVVSSYKVSAIPVSVFINKEGVIVSKQVGTMTYNQMKAKIATLNP